MTQGLEQGLGQSPRFVAASKIVLADEGLYSNDPGDAGGETKYGHDQASWSDLLVRVGPRVREQLPAYVRDLTQEQALLAYEAGYWAPLRGDDFPSSTALALFDSGVNQGLGFAKIALQHALGVTCDGILGPKTLTKAQEVDPVWLLGEFTWRRLLSYRSDGGYETFGHGWETRAIRTAALALSYEAKL